MKDQVFEKAFREVLNFEGGYSDHAADRGGKTRYGITESTARAHGYKGAISDLPLETAKEIYYRSYWSNHLYGQLPEAVAIEMFDQAVNMGTGTANRNLQRCINLLSKSGEIAVDGVIGPATVNACTQVYRLYPADLVLWLNIAQGARYLEIMDRDPEQKVFARGWGRRVKLTKEAVIK